MPNWCNNILTIVGEPKELRKFMDEHGALDFNKIIPYPKEFAHYDKVLLPKLIKEMNDYLVQFDHDEFKELHGFYKGQVSLCDAYNDNVELESGEVISGYNWCTKYWGTKWNALGDVELSDTKEHSSMGYEDDKTSVLEMATMDFNTAWSPPTPIIKKLGEMYPDLAFYLKFWESGAAFKGVYDVIEGKEVTKLCWDYNAWTDPDGYRGG